MEKNFVKVHTAGDIIIAAAFIIAGAALALIFESDALKITGVFCIIAGAAMFFLLKSGYKEFESGEVFSKKNLNFAQSEKKAVISILEKPENFNGKLKQDGTSLMLTIYHNKKDAYLQLFEYIPYSYVACTEMYHYESNKIKSLLK